MTDETFPPCWHCDHPMLSVDVTGVRVVSCHECPACQARTIVPYAYMDEVGFRVVLSDSGEPPQK